MKNRFLDRLLIFCFAVLSCALTVFCALRVFGIDLIQSFFDGLSANAPGLIWRLIVVGLAAIIVLLGVFTVVAITPSRKRSGRFITVNTAEAGDVSIAVSAIQEIVRQSAMSVSGVTKMNAKASGTGDAVRIALAIDLMAGTNVPMATEKIQREVRANVQAKCGVAVSDVSVVVNSVEPLPAGVIAPAPEKYEPAPAQEPASEPETGYEAWDQSAQETPFSFEQEEMAETSEDNFAVSDEGSEETSDETKDEY